MTSLLCKATLLLALALACLVFMRRSSAAARHLTCACAMAGVLLLLLTASIPSPDGPIRLSSVTFLTTSGPSLQGASGHSSTVFLKIWIVGSLIMLFRLAVGYWRLTAILREAAPAGNFFLSDVSVPIVTGLRRPSILVPRSFQSWPAAQRSAALMHELAHVERKDLWTNLIAQAACAVYWFHPLTWAVARLMHDEQETACDDAVLSSGFDPASYAEALIATAKRITSTNLIGVI